MKYFTEAELRKLLEEAYDAGFEQHGSGKLPEDAEQAKTELIDELMEKA